MKRFNFRLEKLLNLREFYEKQAELDLAHAIAEKDAIDIKLKHIATSKIEAGKKIVSNLNVEDLHSTQNYLIRLDIEKEKLLHDIIIAEEKIKEKREKFISAMSKRKIISKLKEKKEVMWKKENLKAEDEFIDDLISFRHNKKFINN